MPKKGTSWSAGNGPSTARREGKGGCILNPGYKWGVSGRKNISLAPVEQKKRDKQRNAY